jgi:hypothetical protein
MATDIERLDEANACHDDEPARGAELLRTIDASQLPSDRWPSYAFLLNHVLGEKLRRWDDALQHQRTLLNVAQPIPAAVLWRQAATAARLANATALASEMMQAFADASGANMERSAELLQLSAAMYLAPGLAAAQAGEQVLAALAPLALPAWQADTPLDATVAACANNIASGLLDRPAADLQHASARSALAQSAEQAHRFWLRAGTWVHQERALYLRAMVCNALGEPSAARSHAKEALALLDAHDRDHAEDVDRAFIELERWCACERLGLASEAAEARTQADALSAKFDDAGLTNWFEQRRQTLKAMLAG